MESKSPEGLREAAKAYLDKFGELEYRERDVLATDMASFAAEQIAAAKAEWIEEFIRECGEADYSLKDGYFAEVLRSVAEKMKESQNGK